MKGQSPRSGGNQMDNGACSYRRFLSGDESAFAEDIAIDALLIIVCLILLVIMTKKGLGICMQIYS